MKPHSKLLGLAAPAFILMGCSSTGEVVEPVEEVLAPVVIEERVEPSVITMPVESIASEITEAYSGDELDDPDSILAVRVIYFEYDSSEIKDEFHSVISAHAAYLIDNPDAFLVLKAMQMNVVLVNTIWLWASVVRTQYRIHCCYKGSQPINWRSSVTVKSALKRWVTMIKIVV